MAIDYRGQVTTTGIMNQSPGANVQVPDMSNLTPPIQQKGRTEQPGRTDQTTPVQATTTGKANAITDEDMAVLSPVLSPSVVNVLRKLVPKFGPFLAQAGTGEENIVLPRSIVGNYAMRNYGGNNEDEAIQSFMTDLSNTQMDNVPLDRTTDQMSSGMMAKNEPPLPEQDDSGIDVSQDLV
jgi:hypothetical protein